MSFPIRIFGDPVLKQRAREVENLDGDLVRLVDNMYDTMYEAVGVGLAAPQVGVQKRLFTYDDHDDDEASPRVIVNPVIVETKGESVFEEGCLSIPGLHFEIVRPELITVQGLDLDGNEVVIEADERLSRIFQHEIDHLDGVLMLDRLEPDERKAALKAIREHDLAQAARHDGAPRL
jgi:peptide deformylase